MQNVTLVAATALAAEVSIAAGFGLFSRRLINLIQRWPRPARILTPSLFVLPYVAVSHSSGVFHWTWFELYAVLPVVIAWLLDHAALADPDQRGNWRDAIILLTLGLTVDLRWFDAAWPPGLAALGKVLLVDAGLYGFLAVRQLSGTGFDFHFQWRDWKTGLRELVFFAPIVLLLGLALHFIHPHANVLSLRKALSWIWIFVFIAVPEELFFRAWVQNMLERRVGRRWALLIASLLFGLSHFNKRSSHFNFSYVFLASIAGIFYGRAWRENRRVPASSITHATVDWLWSLWF